MDPDGERLIFAAVVLLVLGGLLLITQGEYIPGMLSLLLAGWIDEFTPGPFE